MKSLTEVLVIIIIVFIIVALIPSCTSRSGRQASYTTEYRTVFVKADQVVASNDWQVVFDYDNQFRVKPHAVLTWTDTIGFTVIVKITTPRK